MHRTAALVVLALPALLLTGIPARAQPTDAAEVGMIFCQYVIDDTDPTGLLTPELIMLIGDAVARNDEIQAAAPDEKPPLGDGIPWTSFPDRPDTCEVKEVEINPTSARLAVTYAFEDWPDASFTDTLVLKASPMGWYIDDILYVHDLTLRGVLSDVLTQ